MPRPPLGRGCEACRAHKKKCDLLEPTCTRCRKARTTCIGANVRHYKFVDNTKWATTTVQKYQSMGGTDMTLRKVPGTSSTLLAQALVSELRTNDLRYSMPQLWGSFFLDLPRRIGSNPALDAATVAILELQRLVSAPMMDHARALSVVQKYYHSMAVVRQTLNDSIKARQPETLCAVMMILRGSGYVVGAIENFKSPHGNGAAALLRVLGFPESSDPFLASVLNILRTHVALQTIFDASLNFSDDEWQKLEYSCGASGPIWQCVTRIGRFLQNARYVPRGSIEEVVAYSRATDFQHQVERITVESKDAVDNFDPRDFSAVAATHKLAHLRRVYNAAFCIGAPLICIRRALYPDYPGLGLELDLLCSRILSLAEDARVYLPLGANWITLSLMAVWCATKHTEYHMRIEDKLKEYWRDTLPPKPEDLPRGELEQMCKILSLENRDPL